MHSKRKHWMNFYTVRLSLGSFQNLPMRVFLQLEKLQKIVIYVLATYCVRDCRYCEICIYVIARFFCWIRQKLTVARCCGPSQDFVSTCLLPYTFHLCRVSRISFFLPSFHFIFRLKIFFHSIRSERSPFLFAFCSRSHFMSTFFPGYLPGTSVSDRIMDFPLIRTLLGNPVQPLTNLQHTGCYVFAI